MATRYEKLATHYLAMIKLAMIQRCLRLLDPSNRTQSRLERKPRGETVAS